MTKTTDGLYAGRVVNSISRFKIPTKCHICGKTYDVKKQTLHFKHDPSGKINLICDSCMDKWEKDWDLKDAILKEYDPLMWGSFGNGEALCTMKNGRQATVVYGLMQHKTDIPNRFYEQLRELRAKHYAEKNALGIKDIKVIDTFFTQKVVVTQNNGVETTVNFRSGINGTMVFNESEVAKINTEFLAIINKELANRGINLYIK